MPNLDRCALVIVDVQKGFDDLSYWSPTGRRNNPACERNAAALVEEWRAKGRPVILVRHDSDTAGSPLEPGQDGNAFKYGEPDLHAWLHDRHLTGFAVCGIQTNHCVETTARMGGNLGYEVRFVADACHTFDRLDPSGDLMTADELTRATVTSLHGEFADVVNTADLIDAS